MKIAIIGSGSIALGLLHILKNYKNININLIIVRNLNKTKEAKLITIVPFANIVHKLTKEDKPDLIVECASHEAINEHIIPALENGINSIITSVGGLSDFKIYENLIKASEKGKSKVKLISGAIGGIDVLSASSLGDLDEVIYEGQKPPLAWLKTPAEKKCNLLELKEKICIFEGNALESSKFYPKNANVSATVALAGIGFEKTKVKLFANPKIQTNIHNLIVKGYFGNLNLTISGNPLKSNPKTSATTVYSLARAVLNFDSKVII